MLIFRLPLACCLMAASIPSTGLELEYAFQVARRWMTAWRRPAVSGIHLPA